MTATLFISDLHLEPQRPDITQTFFNFLNTEAPAADALYILGDLFELWFGDDYRSEFIDQISQALKQLSKTVPIYLIHGNRDFLMGEQFAAHSGCQLLHEGLVELYGKKVLLLHGDTLCIDDIKYMQFRAFARHPANIASFLQKPLAERQLMLQQIRHASEQNRYQEDNSITDANLDEVARVMTAAATDLLIHGHTHRPAIHSLTVQNQPATRIVLGDWHQQAWVLRYGPQSYQLEHFPLLMNINASP